MNKKIANVVFYKFWDPTREEPMQQACIFYEDGTVKNTTHEEGIDAAFELANADRLTGKQFRSIMNNKKVFTLTGEEFENRFQEFVMVSRKNVEAAVNDAMEDVDATKRTGAAVIQQKKAPVTPVTTTTVTPDKKATVTPAIPTDKSKAKPATDTTVEPVIVPITNPTASEEKKQTEKTTDKNNGTKIQPIPVVIPVSDKKTEKKSKENEESSSVVPPVVSPVDTTTAKDSAEAEVENGASKPLTQAEKVAAKNNGKKKKDGLWARFKKSKLGKRVMAVVLAVSMIVGSGFVGFHLGRNTKEGQITSSNFSIEEMNDNRIEEQDIAYLSLLNSTKNEDLKTIMTRQGERLDMFNRDFAEVYMEDGKDVKAALTWDELVALDLAYNEYTKDQIRVMFNGSEVDSTAMSHAYKNATLQLMGAFVISDRENPVNMSAFVNSDEAKAFVEKYEDLFYTCKETRGDAQVAAVKAFYTELYKDFPISDEVREEGLSHADSRSSVKQYMAAVTPMVAAAEIMFQNLDIDHTLTDKATAYFNDIGLCNLAEESFERAQTITLTAETDESLPTYEQFRATKIEELTIEGNYVIDDEHRDLSKLDAFQYWVNGGYLVSEETTTTTHTVVTTHTDTTYHTETSRTETNDRDEAVAAAGEDAVKKAEEAANAKIEQENAQAKDEGEKKAEEVRQELQDKADEEAAKLEEQVRQDEADLQDKIDDANDVIDQGGTVTEDDLGHGVDFDDQHSNENGELDDSVTDITTDGSGAVDSSEPLPDPNVTGESFDNGTSTSTTTEEYYDEDIYSYEEPYYGGMSNDEIVDAMIAEMEASSNEVETAKQYTK